MAISFDPTAVPDSEAYVKSGRVWAEIVGAEEVQGQYGDGVKLKMQALWPKDQEQLLVTDTLWFDQGKAGQRAKLVLKRLGFDLSVVPVVITPADFLEKRCWVIVRPREVGDRVYGNVVYDGYHPADAEGQFVEPERCAEPTFGRKSRAPAMVDDDDPPF